MLENFQVPPFITYAIPFFFLLIGIEFFISLKNNKNFYHQSNSIADLSTGILSQIFGLFTKTIYLLGYFFLYQNYRIFNIPDSSILTWVLCFILVDFFYYWYHRLSHEVNILWAGHVVHHQSEDYNLIVALRQTSLGSIFSWIFYLPLAWLGFSPWIYLACYQLNLIYQFWVHTKSIGKLPAFIEYIFLTPSHHRVHHGVNPEYIDRNHAGVFVIFDRIFGTFEEEKAVPVYGTVKPLTSLNPFYANYYYFIELFKASVEADKWTDKINVWFKAPGYYPAISGKPSGYLPIPEVDAKTFKMYLPDLNNIAKRYVLFSFVLILLISFAYLVLFDSLSRFTVLSLGIWISLSLISINGVSEKKSWSLYTEILRITFIPFIDSIVFKEMNIILILSYIFSCINLAVIFFFRKKLVHV
ncbi:MAG: sterol desaturase family protein [Leptospiraceae bacterium]|nr:sterol desaturase family protein [Leptospiraceae bacterium]